MLPLLIKISLRLIPVLMVLFGLLSAIGLVMLVAWTSNEEKFRWKWVAPLSLGFAGSILGCQVAEILAIRHSFWVYIGLGTVIGVTYLVFVTNVVARVLFAMLSHGPETVFAADTMSEEHSL